MSNNKPVQGPVSGAGLFKELAVFNAFKETPKPNIKKEQGGTSPNKIAERVTQQDTAARNRVATPASIKQEVPRGQGEYKTRLNLIARASGGDGGSTGKGGGSTGKGGGSTSGGGGSKDNKPVTTVKPSQSQKVNDRLNFAAERAAAGDLEGALRYANAAHNLSRSQASRQNTANVRNNIWDLVQKQRAANLNPVFGPRPEDPKTDPKTSSVDIPITPTSVGSAPVPSQTLLPGRDVVNFTEVVSSPEAMQQILFEELSSFELVNMARGDTVEGLNPYYSVISNLSSLRRQYNPSQIISLQTPIQNSFDIYQISLIDKIPGDEYIAGDFFYIDTNGDFVIELINMESDEVVEIQIATSGRII